MDQFLLELGFTVFIPIESYVPLLTGSGLIRSGLISISLLPGSLLPSIGCNESLENAIQSNRYDMMKALI